MRSLLPQIPQLLLFVALLVGCTPTSTETTSLFESAEAHYVRGDYDEAQRLYQLFINQSPDSPLTELAEQRMRTMVAERDAVMSRRGAPAPLRLHPYGNELDESPEYQPVRVELPTLPEFGE